MQIHKVFLLLALCLSAALNETYIGEDTSKIDGDVSKMTLDYGTSELYTKEDIDAAADVVKESFKTINGATLYSLTYAGDEVSERELASYKSYRKEDYVKCIVFKSSFHTPKVIGRGFERDADYTWSWTLVCEADGVWELISYGYG